MLKTIALNAALYAARRLREPSTLAALGVLGVAFGLPPGAVDLVGQVVAGVAALAAIVMPDKKASE